jgi:hypothetical protein
MMSLERASNNFLKPSPSPCPRPEKAGHGPLAALENVYHIRTPDILLEDIPHNAQVFAGGRRYFRHIQNSAVDCLAFHGEEKKSPAKTRARIAAHKKNIQSTGSVRKGAVSAASAG